ncbi:MAG TPA: hypothetical protein VFE41_05295 [Acetobacteraceae bacterium]|nr:hypothetical protein [Acetobacteraceae bacterium]
MTAADAAYATVAALGKWERLVNVVADGPLAKTAATNVNSTDAGVEISALSVTA